CFYRGLGRHDFPPTKISSEASLSCQDPFRHFSYRLLIEHEDFEVVSRTIACTKFFEDQTGFRAGEYILSTPGPDPIIGTASLQITETEFKENTLSLSDMEMLSIEVGMIPRKPLLATIQTLADVIPMGIFNYIPLQKVRNDPGQKGDSGF